MRKYREWSVLLALGVCCTTAAVGKADSPAAQPGNPAQPAAPAASKPDATKPASSPPAANPASGAPAGPDSGAPQTSSDLSQGVFRGRVVDLDGKPIPNATVAIQDQSGKTVAWTKTDAQGTYALPADTLKVLRLQPSRHRGLLTKMAHGVGQVAMLPVKVAGAAVNFAAGAVKTTVTDTAGTARAAAISAATGNPGPLASQVAGKTLQNMERSAKSRAKANAQSKAAAALSGDSTKDLKKELAPGEVILSVSAPGYKEVKDKNGAYWLDAPTTDKSSPVGTQAWLETAKLAPVQGDKKSAIPNEAVLLSDAHLDPALAPAGSNVSIQVKLQVPDGLTPGVRVFAVEAHDRQIAELKDQGKGVYSGTLALNPSAKPGETTVSIAAFHTEPVEVSLKQSKGDPLSLFVQRLDDMQADKPYLFDPRVEASENRLDATLNILDPKQGKTALAPPSASHPVASAAGTPAAPGAAPPTPAKPAPASAPPGNPPAPAQPAGQPATPTAPATPTNPPPAQPAGQPATPTAPATPAPPPAGH